MVTSLLLWTGQGLPAWAEDPEDPPESPAPPATSQAGTASPDSTQAATSPQDSTQGTQAPPPTGGGAGPNLRDAGKASTNAGGTGNAGATGAGADTLGMAAPGFQLLGPIHPIATFKFGASVQSVDLSTGLDLPLELLDGFSTASSYQRSFSNFRQRDRESDNEKMSTAWQRKFSPSLNFSMRFDRNNVRDEERISGNAFVIENTDQNGEAKLGGGGTLAQGLKHSWGVRGRVQDAKSSNRGTDNNRALRYGGTSVALDYDLGDWAARAEVGGDRARGDRQLRGKTSPARTATDTLGARLNYRGSEGLSLNFDTRHVRFDERRLDFPKDALGRVDTLRVEDDNLKVQDEREQRTTDEFAVKASAPLFPGVSVDGSYSHDMTETTFQLNQQGLLQRASDVVDVAATFQHADASSLMVAYGARQDWTDQLQKGRDVFRGRETSRSKNATLTLQQALFSATALRALVSQELKQFVNEEKSNPNDRDELYERFDLTLTTTAVPNLTASVRASANFVRSINIDEALVPNNRERRTYDVGTGFTWTGISRLSLHQDYGLNIVFQDYYASDNNDEFNKQGAVTSDATLMLPSKVSVLLRHVFDLRKNGRRNLKVADAYNTTLLSKDNQFTMGITVPIQGFNVKVETRRGALREENPQLAVERRLVRDERSGDLRTGVSGKREFLKKRLTVDLRVERVLAYGPRVRAEDEDYVVANSTVTVKF